MKQSNVALANLVVLLSGGGCKLQAILDATVSGEIDANVVLVVSNRKNAFGLERAKRAGIDSLYMPLRPFLDLGRDRDSYDMHLVESISRYKPDWIVSAGWMHVLSSQFLDCFPNRVINVHPALPGAFPGKLCLEDAYEAFMNGTIEHSGCMVHYVTPELDQGPVIVQRKVDMLPDDSLTTFETRMQHVEGQILIEALQQILNAVPSPIPSGTLP